jgi:hypothetical protein
MMEAMLSSETSVLANATRSNVPEDGILHYGEYFWNMKLRGRESILGRLRSVQLGTWGGGYKNSLGFCQQAVETAKQAQKWESGNRHLVW